ncbi:MAG: ribulose-phosphate 3-epimerase, partial [Krumholzibacteria bacterium]|nr:ribulose-phosphate 3-epimerase [Candidatus Krumholzibacteria bacterium]
MPRPAEGTAWVAPSLLSADFARLADDIAAMTAAGCDLLHLDVMDGHFVPNLTFGPLVCQAVRRVTALPLDAHLMMTHPDRFIEPFAAAGVDGLTVHVEAEAPLRGTLRRIGDLGMKRGISLNPGTPLDLVEPWLGQVDLVLVMTVQPGFGGQAFDPAGVAKIAELARRRAAGAGDFLINVDGGINADTGRVCREAGADILVSGSWLFGAGDRGARIALL